MKKFLSTILAVVMVLSSMAMVVSANDADYAEGYYYVNGVQYTDFMAAVSAANGGTVIVSGECAFGSRLAVNSSVTLQGVNDATIVPSASYGSTDSDTNWKGLLNIAGENVVVNDITFDGSLYGDSITSSTDFVPVRCTSGNITLNNVTIKGSPRSLMIVGSSSSEANVTAINFKAYGELKNIVESATYADINVVDGTFTMTSGTVDGFICEENANTFDVSAAGHYTFTYTPVLITEERVCTTPKHIADTYLNSNPSNTIKRKYMSALAENDTTTTSMLNYVATNISTMSDVATDLVEVIEDMEGLSFISNANKTKLAGYKTILTTALGNIAE